jgi:Cd2+/Zn2+-exporting ATPase
MDFLMSIAVIGAMIIGEWTEAAYVIFLFSLAELIESYSVKRARRSIESLMELAPNLALVKTDSGNVEKPVDGIEVGSVVIIRPGDRIPLDGEVIAGSSAVDQAPITGESIPVDKSPGEEVFAGTINQQGVLEVKVSKRSQDSMLARIIRLVEEAQARKAPTQQFVEKFSRYYTPAMVTFAVLVAVIPPLLFGGVFVEWFYRALVLLVISCPCPQWHSDQRRILPGKF